MFIHVEAYEYVECVQNLTYRSVLNQETVVVMTYV